MPKRNQPSVRNNLLSADDAEVQVGTRRWHTWLADHTTFVFQGIAGHLTARCETRRNIPYWYGYRWRAGKLAKTYLGKSVDLTAERLEQACARLAGQNSRTIISPQSDSAEWIVALNQPSATTVSPERTEAGLSYLPLTKVRPPALPQKLVARPRLTQRINAPITMLIAPSGFGKSTLLNEWRQMRGIPVAWVSLDADDNQPLRFWSTIIAALQTVYPNLGQDLPTPLRILSSADLNEIVVGLTNAIVCASDAPDAPPRLGLVLDDYHHIHDKEIHASLQTWLEHLPPTLQLILSSHIKPPLDLGHLRAHGMVAELDAEDLRFTLEEGIGYLSQHTQDRPLAYSEMQSIIKRAEGWAAGLTLATLALNRTSEQSTVETFAGTQDYLREFFIERILYRQPPSAQEFLLETAILKHLTGSLCDAVTGRNDGTAMLDYLWRENLFLVRLEEPGWYRYHDLFAETLCRQLQRQLASGIPRLHRRAAEWYRAHNAPDDAVYHLLAIEAWEEAASLIEDIVLRELEQFGDYSRLMRWLRQLPEAVMQQHRTLLRVYVRVAAMDLSRIEVKHFLNRVETNITRKPTAEQTAVEQSVLAEIQRIRQMWTTGDAGLMSLSKAGEHDDVWQMLDGIVAYAGYIRRDSEKAETVARELYEMAHARSHLYVMLISGGGLTYYLALRGQLRRAENIARQVLQHAMAQCGRLPESASVALTMLSRVYYERNQLTQAHQLLLRAAEADPNPTSSNMPIMEAMQHAKIEFAQGNATAAMATLQAARELQVKHPSGLYRDRDLLAYQAWFCLRQNDCAGAERLLSEVGENEPHAFATLVRAALWVEQGQALVAENVLRDLINRYSQGLYLEPILGARILLARALFEQHQVNQARQVMTEAIRFAYPADFVRPFLDYRADAPLLTLVLHTSNLTSDAQSFVKQLLRLLTHTDGATQFLPKSELTSLSTVASITAREHQVLRLITSGLTNREIAAQLSFAESTVKTHLKNIYRKLGVNSRTQAIAQAQTLKLV